MKDGAGGGGVFFSIIGPWQKSQKEFWLSAVFFVRGQQFVLTPAQRLDESTCSRLALMFWFRVNDLSFIDRGLQIVPYM